MAGNITDANGHARLTSPPTSSRRGQHDRPRHADQPPGGRVARRRDIREKDGLTVDGLKFDSKGNLILSTESGLFTLVQSELNTSATVDTVGGDQTYTGNVVLSPTGATFEFNGNKRPRSSTTTVDASKGLALTVMTSGVAEFVGDVGTSGT